MSLKMVFLGTGSAFTLGCGNFQSNALLIKNDDTLLLDAGTDLRFSLYEQGMTYKDIKNLYISHMHGDHIGGLEWLALTTHFEPSCTDKPRLIASEIILKDLWDHSMSGGLSTIANEKATIDTFFDVSPIGEQGTFYWQDITFKLVQMVHAASNYVLMPCFGLLFESNGTRIFYTADTQYVPHLLSDYYNEADLIFHDCETSKTKSGVHAHYTELVKLPEQTKKKMWLYHFSPGALPDAKADGFLGFVSKGQGFEL